LRRAIGLKKDEYFLDRKHVTKHDVINLLESAGFSRSNPYYIVQQGRVNLLTLMKDSERLDLLKEVAGTRVYDERKAESLKIRTETDNKRGKINETLTYIEERLKELEEEGEELQKYLSLDKQRRALEYRIEDVTHEDTLQKLQKNEADRQAESKNSTEKHGIALDARNELVKIEKELKGVNNEINVLQREKERVDAEKDELTKERAKLELDIADSDRKIQREKETSSKMTKDLAKLEKDIDAKTKEFEEIKSTYTKEVAEEQEIENALTDKTRQVNQLYAKQGRKSQFKNAKERDDFIKKEVTELNKQIKAKEKQIKEIQKEVDDDDKNVEKNKKELKEGEDHFTSKKNEYEGLLKNIEDLKIQRDNLANDRKDMWRDDVSSETRMKSTQEELGKAERRLGGSVNQGISIGLSAVLKIVKQHKISGVPGPLFELFEVGDEFITAVEVTAGNSLFHIVVDTDETASRILDHLGSDFPGKVTFMPLNRLNPPDISMPQSEDVSPLLNHIKMNNGQHKKAFQQIFGRTLLCNNIDVATTFSREYELDCVTIAGDQVNRRGAMTGGFVDTRYSRLACIKDIKRLRNELKELKATSDSAVESLQRMDQDISTVLGKMHEVEARKESERGDLDKVLFDNRTRQQSIDAVSRVLEQKNIALNGLKSTLNQLQETKSSLEAELGTKLDEKLTKAEQEKLVELNEEIDGLKSSLMKASNHRAGTETNKSVLESLLFNNLKPQRDRLNAELSGISLGEENADKASNQRQLESNRKTLAAAQAQSEQLDKEMDAKEKKRLELTADVDKQKGKENQERRKLQEESEKMERILNQRSLLLQKKDECERRLSDFGSLPLNELEKLKGKDLKTLVKQLHSTNQELKKFSHVNKKALDQKIQFTEQTER